jgi:hypothetical protein
MHTEADGSAQFYFRFVFLGHLIMRQFAGLYLSSPSGCIVKLCDGICFAFATVETLMAKELKNKRDEAKQAWDNATVVMKKSKNADDFTGSKKAHDEAEKLRVEYLMAEKVSEADSDDENTLAMSAHG